MSTVNGIDTSKATDLSSVDNKQSTLDKDAFLQLLVTQMKYQDPLEPSSSTEYMSQLAQFTSLEEMENLNKAFNQSDAQSLVGSYVIMKTIDATGKEKFVSGLVDYVTINNGKPYLSINDQYYDYEDLDSVVDVDYIAAMDKSDDASDTAGNDKTGAE
ncbi:MAG: flagellar hook capping FlgD N-terminal domain-containing protein [Lachnospiraceae bacterium]|nr:flagellar hook capping FlgD N-terminal domain-containing protein [Lachnospiraceae bacterium]